MPLNSRVDSKRSGRCFPRSTSSSSNRLRGSSRRSSPTQQQQLDDALYASAETLRIAVALLHPMLPESTANIWAQLGMTQPLENLELARLDWGQLAAGQPIGDDRAGLSRASMPRALSNGCGRSKKKRQRGRRSCWASSRRTRGESQALPPPSPKIDIEDFVKVDLRVGQVLSAERVKGADKLLHLKVDIGEPEPRTIVAGIAKAYEPEQMVGRKVVIVANLQPRKLRGIESNGMIVAASLEGGIRRAGGLPRRRAGRSAPEIKETLRVHRFPLPSRRLSKFADDLDAVLERAAQPA